MIKYRACVDLLHPYYKFCIVCGNKSLSGKLPSEDYKAPTLKGICESCENLWELKETPNNI